jgi:threonine dehydratase
MTVSPTTPKPLTADAVRAAAARIKEHIVRTPTLPSDALSRATGAQVTIKY